MKQGKERKGGLRLGGEKGRKRKGNKGEKEKLKEKLHKLPSFHTFFRVEEKKGENAI